MHPRIRIEPTGLALIDTLLSDPRPWTSEGHGLYMDSWRLTLPSDREAVAMHLLPHLLNTWDRAGYFHEYVAALFSQDGPTGEATALLISVQLTEIGMFAWPERGRRLLLGAAAALPARRGVRAAARAVPAQGRGQDEPRTLGAGGMRETGRAPAGVGDHDRVAARLPART
ncbi:hypothetical protein ACFQX6_15800 [Streptosporangium lutulentum]